MKKYLLFSIFVFVTIFSKAQLPVASFSVDDSTICPGTCTSFVNLSTNATSYQWSFQGGSPSTSTTANPQNICYNNPGVFSVTLIASNSMGSDTVTINNCLRVYPNPPGLGETAHGDTLFATPGFMHYQWYFNFVPIPGDTLIYHVAIPDGTHTIVATDSNGCEVEAVGWGDILYPDFVPSDSIICDGECISFTNLSNPDSGMASHQWHFDGATPGTSLINDPQNICYPIPGDYWVKLVMVGSTTSKSDSMIIHVLNCTNVLENSLQQISIYPNPFSSEINLHFDLPQNENVFLKIINVIGETVSEKLIKLIDQSLNLSELPEGIYLLSIQNGNGIFTKKILKQY